MEPSNKKIVELLRKQYVEGVFYTHVSLVQPKGRFQINRNELDIFWDVYNESVMNETCIVGLAEKPQQYLPVLADIDLKVKDDVVDDSCIGEHLYSEKQCRKVIEIYQSALREIIHNCSDDNLLCVLLEKPIYYVESQETTYIKNGFHLHFPNTIMNRAAQEIHLIPKVKEAIKKLKVFSNLGIEDSSETIDNSVCNNHWLLYGSIKSENMDPYRLSKVIDSNGQEIQLEEAFKNYKIYDCNEQPLVINNRVIEYLPRILSIIPWGRPTQEIKPSLANPAKDIKTKENTKVKNNDNLTIKQILEISEQLMPMISDKRADDYHEWMTLGWILYNIGNGCTEALEQWLSFSKKSEKYDETMCLFLWGKMEKRDYTLGTLHFLASKDSPEKYREFTKKKIDEKVKDSLEGCHNDIARVLYEDYKNEFICGSVANKTWYQFKNHIWEEVEEGTTLREKISSETIVGRYARLANEYFAKMVVTQDKAEDSSIQTRIKQIQKIINNLKSSPYKNHVMKECMEVFYKKDFTRRLNTDKFLIAFKNGVYDLKLCIFRDGMPEDYISKSLPIEYKEYNEIDEEVQNVIEFLKKVFPDSSIRKYFLDTYSDIFVGGNAQKKIYLWTGEGDNGKSITQSFFDKMLGELAVKFNTQYFTGKKVSSGSANPELARAAPPVRHATMEEPDADEELNIGELKKLSGGDTYWARDLFEKGKNTREVEPQFTLTFICNKLPRLKYSDKATWNRLRVIPFEATFVEPGQPCPETFEEQLREKRFPMDKTFSGKIPGMVSAFAWYLLKWRQTVLNRTEPFKVQDATAIYRRQNDVYRQYIKECVIYDDKTILSLSEIYISFKEWYREGWTNMNIPNKNDVREYLEKMWGESLRGYKWRGYRIRTIDEDDVNEDGTIANNIENYKDDGKALPPL